MELVKGNQAGRDLDVGSAAALLSGKGLEGSAGEAVMPGHLAAHAELLLAVMAGFAHVFAPGGNPVEQRQECQVSRPTYAEHGVGNIFVAGMHCTGASKLTNL